MEFNVSICSADFSVLFIIIDFRGRFCPYLLYNADLTAAVGKLEYTFASIIQ